MFKEQVKSFRTPPPLPQETAEQNYGCLAQSREFTKREKVGTRHMRDQEPKTGQEHTVT